MLCLQRILLSLERKLSDIELENNGFFQNTCTINNKINGTAKGVYLHNLKLHSILPEVNLLAHNNFSLSNTSKFATGKLECIFEMGK